MAIRLTTFLERLHDPRRSQGIRYSLPSLVSMVLMAIISGENGIRGFHRFAVSNKEDIIEVFGLKHGVPGYGTFQSLINKTLDLDEITEAFLIWAEECSVADQDEKYHIAIDGKALRSTLSGKNTPMQRMVTVISAFAHDSGLTLGVERMQGDKGDEALRAIDLIGELGLTGVTYTMDAAYAKKRSLK